MNTTRNRIRELRIKNNLTLDDVARHLGVGRQAIYKYEKGTVTNIPLENIEKMADLFGTSPGYLAGWIDQETEADMNNLIDSINGIVPQSPEALILAKGIDKLPQEQREQALAVIRAMFANHADYFEKENSDGTEL